MHLVTIAWVFVVVLMALAEATSPRGTVLGALFTLLLYGALPLGIVLYLMGTPGRRRARRQEQALADAAAAAASAATGDGSSHAAGVPVAPVGKEP